MFKLRFEIVGEIYQLREIFISELSWENCFIRRKYYEGKKSRILWLHEGDRSTKFFHLSSVIHHPRNWIDMIKDDEGNVLESRPDIANAFLRRFMATFSSDAWTDLENMIGVICNLATDDDNDSLCRHPSDEEIKEVVFQIHPWKSLDPDGFSGIFYHFYWDLIKTDVITAVWDFFTSRIMPAQHNQTNLVLIPKCERPSGLNDYGLISLCNLIYKIISKLLSNRLKGLMPKLISPHNLR